MTLVPTPSQTVGPFVHIGFAPMTVTEVPAEAAGSRITVSGRVLDGAREPIPDAVLELWQANAAGRYDHPEDRRNIPPDGAFEGFLRVPTDVEGRFRFRTVKPGPVPGPAGTMQAPHILVCLFMRGLLRHLYTRIYFEGEAANAADPILSRIEEGRRHTLVARRQPGDGAYGWDVLMQGEDETVFLDL